MFNEKDLILLQEEHKSDIISNIAQFSASEISAFDSKLLKFRNLSEIMKEQKNHFIEQFANHVPVFMPKYFSDKLEADFKKEYPIQSFPVPLHFFHEQIELTKWKSKKVYNRLNKSSELAKVSNYYSYFLKSMTQFLEECELGKESFQSANACFKYSEIVLKYDFYDHLCNFQINNLYQMFKRFPLLKRQEIFLTATKRLISDISIDMNPLSIPTVIFTTEQLYNELKRLSGLLDIEFDINSQDGQHFSYSCQKIYSENVCKVVDFNNDIEEMPMINNPSFLDRLNYSFIENTEIDIPIQVSFNNLLNPDIKGTTIMMRKFDAGIIKELTRDKVTALLRLQFTRNKCLLHSIINSINKIQEIRKYFDINTKPESNFFDLHFLIFRKTILAVTSSVKATSKKISIDVDSLLENVLFLYDEFLKCKVKILGSFTEINENTSKINLKEIAEKFIEIRPDFIGGKHQSCLQAFRLSVDTMKNISVSIQSLINLQINNQKKFGIFYGKYFPWFEFPQNETIINQRSAESFPYSPFETFPFLKIILKFLKVSENISSEITNSFAIRSYQYNCYFHFAIWSQLIEEMKNFFLNSSPETYIFNTKMSEKIKSTMTSPFLCDLNYIFDIINNTNEDERAMFSLKLRNMIQLGWKLQSFLIQSDMLLSTYKNQFSNIKEDNTEQLLDFAFGDFDFSAISCDWMPNELEKIVNAQHNYILVLETAIRFNNYYNDIFSIESILEMNQTETKLQEKTQEIELLEPLHQKILKSIPTRIFFEPELINKSLYSKTFCSISEINNFVDSDTLIKFYIPYSLKSEIAFLCTIENGLLHHFSNYEVFSSSVNPTDNILDANGNLNHFFVPNAMHCLSLSFDGAMLFKVLKFASIRYQMLQYMQHDIYISQTKPRTLENIFDGNLMWSSPFFSRINVEIHRYTNCNDINFSIDYFHSELETYCAKQVLVSISLLEAASSSETPLYSLESVKSYLVEMNMLPFGNPSFLTPSLYAQNYLNQFWYQHNDQFRADFSNGQSQMEQLIDDSVVGFKDAEYRITSHDFSLGLMQLNYLKLGFYELLAVKDPSKVTIRSSIENLTNESLKKGSSKYDSKVNIKSTARIGTRPSFGTIETQLLKERTKVLLDVVNKKAEKYQIRIANEIFDKEKDEILSAFSVPAVMLKPECYNKKIHINANQRAYLPAIPDIEEQFMQEIRYARSRFCTSLCRFTATSMKNSGKDEFIINTEELHNKMKSLSVVLDNYMNIAGDRLRKTWRGYLQIGLTEFIDNDELQLMLNFFVQKFVFKYNQLIDFYLSAKLNNDYLTLARLRDEERAIYLEQEKFEKEQIKAIRQEFDLLVSDLKEEIRKAKLRFVQAKNVYFKSANTAISKYSLSANFIQECVSIPKQANDKNEQEESSMFDNDENQEEETEEENTSLAIPHSTTPDLNALMFTAVEVTAPTTTVSSSKKNVKETHSFDKILTKNILGDEFPRRLSGDHVPIQICEPNQEKESFRRRNMRKAETHTNLTSPRKTVKEVADRFEETKKEIEKLKKQAKKLRISTTLSGLAVRKIYTRMIAKVAEERKSFSQQLWHGRRLFEEDLVELNRVLHDEYSKLTKAEIEIENLHKEIDETKQTNIKLNHWKEMNLRQTDNIHKELKRLSDVHGDVNITQLLEKIQMRQNELEMLDYENQKLEEEIYFQVKEPMMQYDNMRKALQRKIVADFQPLNQTTQQDQQNLDDQNNQQEISNVEKEQILINSKIEENQSLKKDNEELKMQIAEIEKQLKDVPSSRVPLIENLFGQDCDSSRPKSNRFEKKIVKPGRKRILLKSSRPNTSRR